MGSKIGPVHSAELLTISILHSLLSQKFNERLLHVNISMHGMSKLYLNFETVPYFNRVSQWLTDLGPLSWKKKQTVSALCQLQPAT